MSDVYIGVDGKARKVVGMWAGDTEGKARPVSAVFQGDTEGKANLVWGPAIGDEYSVRITTYENRPTSGDYPVSIVPCSQGVAYTKQYGIEFKDLNADEPVWTALTATTELSFDSDFGIDILVRGTASLVRLDSEKNTALFSLSDESSLNTTYSMKGHSECLVNYTDYAKGNYIERTCAYNRLFVNSLWIGDLSEFIVCENDRFAQVVNGGYTCAYMFSGCTNLKTPPRLPATSFRQVVHMYEYMFQDCTALTTAPELPATFLDADYEYCYMFSGCTALTNAPRIAATRLSYGSCWGMFQGCTALTTAPELPADSLDGACYSYMFQGCTALTTAPELPATTLANSCYSRMFYGCRALTTAPELPATELAQSCYSYMFQDCTALTTPPRLPATTLEVYCYCGMFENCRGLTGSPPTLSATVIPNSAYRQMFEGCTGLETGVGLSEVTAIGSYGCANMFAGCTSIVTPVVFNSDKPVSFGERACYYMFESCTGLDDMLPEIWASEVGDRAFQGMFKNCGNRTGFVPILIKGYHTPATGTPPTDPFDEMMIGCDSDTFGTATPLTNGYAADLAAGGCALIPIPMTASANLSGVLSISSIRPHPSLLDSAAPGLYLVDPDSMGGNVVTNGTYISGSSLSSDLLSDSFGETGALDLVISGSCLMLPRTQNEVLITAILLNKYGEYLTHVSVYESNPYVGFEAHLAINMDVTTPTKVLGLCEGSLTFESLGWGVIFLVDDCMNSGGWTSVPTVYQFEENNITADNSSGGCGMDISL